MICRRDQKENDELLYTVWSLVMVRNQLPAQVVNLLRWNDMPRTSRIFCKIAILQNCNSFKYILKYNPDKENTKYITSRSFLFSDITPTEFRRQRKRRIIVYGSGHSLWSAISCQRKKLTSKIVIFFLSFKYI